MSKGVPALPEPGNIALYGSKSVSQNWFWSYRAGAELVGTVSALQFNRHHADRAKRNCHGHPGECHYRDGPLIYTTEVHPDPHIESRLYGPEADMPKYRTLEPVNDDQINRPQADAHKRMVLTPRERKMRGK